VTAITDKDGGDGYSNPGKGGAENTDAAATVGRLLVLSVEETEP